MNTLATYLVIQPFTNIRIPMRSLPNTIALLTTHKPFPFINLPRSNPMKNSLSMWFIIKKLALIKIMIFIFLKSNSLSLIQLPLSLINPTSISNQHPQSLSFTILQLSFIKCILISFNIKILHICNLPIIKNITYHVIIFICQCPILIHINHLFFQLAYKWFVRFFLFDLGLFGFHYFIYYLLHSFACFICSVITW